MPRRPLLPRLGKASPGLIATCPFRQPFLTEAGRYKRGPVFEVRGTLPLFGHFAVIWGRTADLQNRSALHLLALSRLAGLATHAAKPCGWRVPIADARRRPSAPGRRWGGAGHRLPDPDRCADFAIFHLDGCDANSSIDPAHACSISRIRVGACGWS